MIETREIRSLILGPLVLESVTGCGFRILCFFLPLLCTIPAKADYQNTVRPLLQKYCFQCHGPKKQEGEMRLDELSPTIAALNDLERWVDVGDKLKSGDMPPAKAAQPTVDELSQLIGWVSDNIRTSATRLKKPERLRVRRLTREQYTATLQDLLSLPLNFGELLPEESPSEEGFTNDAELLNFSGTHMETFVETARAAIDQAVVQQDSPEPGFQFGLSMPDFAKAFEQGVFSTSRFVPIYDGRGLPVPAANDPRRIFARMFGDNSAESISAHRGELHLQRSILDTVLENARGLKPNLGKADLDKLDQYMESVRDVEQRVVKAEQWLDRPKPQVSADDINFDITIEEPREFVRTYYDLMVLAFQTDSTRVATYQICPERGLSRKVSNFGKSLGLFRYTSIRSTRSASVKVA